MQNLTTLGEPSRTFETPDLNLASFLYCRSFPVLDLRRLGDKKTAFIFGDSPALRVALLDYANDGVVPVRTFSTTLRDLKAITP